MEDEEVMVWACDISFRTMSRTLAAATAKEDNCIVEIEGVLMMSLNLLRRGSCKLFDAMHG